MKRALSSLIFAGATLFAVAQGSFTIVRPFDGSKVREMVKVLFPASSVPKDTGYVGIFVDGEFVEAISPKLSADKKYFEYTLDTKAFKDGNHKLEAKLYVDYSNQPRIVDTSSVDVVIANETSIPVPEDGFMLKYKFVPGTEHIYRLQQRVFTSAITEENQKKQGSRPFQIQEEGESLKMLYACDNSYSNGDGLIRMQVVPDKGIKNREFAYLTTSSSGGVPKKIYPEDMAGIYMRVTPQGREQFGAIPDYFGLDGNAGVGARYSLWADFPLPTLPSKRVKPGDPVMSTWQSNFQLGSIDLQNLHTQKSVVEIVPARGEFLGVEWEMGHPCAKIKNSIAQGSAPSKVRGASAEGPGGTKISDRKVSMEETIWFALDTGTVIKYFRDITVEGKADFGLTDGGSGGGASQGPTSAGQGSSGPRSNGKGGNGGINAGDFHQGPSRGAPGQGGRPTGGPGMGAPGAPGMGQGGGMGTGQQSGSAGFVRVRMQMLFVLEK